MRDRCRNIDGFGGLIVTNEAAAPIPAEVICELGCELVEARVWSVVLWGSPLWLPQPRHSLPIVQLEERIWECSNKVLIAALRPTPTWSSRGPECLGGHQLLIRLW